MDVESHYQYIMDLTEYAYEKLCTVPVLRIKGQVKDGKQTGIISFVVEGYRSDDVGSILDEEFDIAVRTGYHCAPYIHDYLKDKPYGGTTRIGLGQYNTRNDIDKLTEALGTL
jgi:selenocysteine lyase/cysteine desulfurase